MDIRSAAEKIIALKNADMALRNRLIQSKQLHKAYNKEMEALHIKNADQLNEIIESIGFPSMEKVGKEANEAAWLIIQHAISKPEFMRKCMALMGKQVKQTLEERRQIAYLMDRIAVFEGKPQLYGTQFDWDEKGLLGPSPHDGLERVNKRRKSIGFNSLEEQTDLMRDQVKNENQIPPSDFELRKKEIESWKKTVGWIID
ncbi:DUF6624 domain-containing protein [Arthrospiribacter ruber]|uniref:Uncharacterized protein n=1 Tax=Arthrospiribacter ruber TaxID=2487934 RepID=A0A951MBH0_9BACT|nr:DUF6624 domain-containing protein [Arthrospiribacter ruber]MBW3466812.1 hypothetical protein [Arthrospiribacter ruber]MBW3469604.1 hypothetical protein [Arthrospiribacter ruber]MBW3470321.1 hypothetical protein [Arthrospiribacter ruber]